MEAFSLLKYWRVGGGNNVGGGSGVGCVGDSGANVRNGTTTIVTAVTPNTTETDDDDGPFFDLEFAVPDEEEEEEDDDADGGDANSNANSNSAQNGSNCENESEEDDDNEEEEEEDQDDESDVGVGEREFKFTLSSGSSDDRTDPNLSLSPSDDLFFKGRLVPIESSSLVFNPSESEPNSKPQFPVSLLKSATKFRVFMLGLKKSKPNTTEKPDSNGSVPAAASKQQNKQEETQQKQPEEQEKQEAPQQQQSKFFTVKFKVEEVPIVSLFTRDNSRSASGNNKAQKQSIEESASDEKRFSKDMMQKYLKKVKPLYVRVSKRYGEKLRFSGQLSLGAGAKAAPPAEIPAPVKTAAEKNQAEPPEATAPAPAPAPEGSVSNVKSQKLTNFPTGLRVVCKHLGKSRSASSAVAAAPPGPVASKRRDDSLLQQQDGIQGAIMHCKRSFHASRDSDSSLLSRSVSDPSHEKCSELLLLSRKSSDEGKGGRSCS